MTKRTFDDYLAEIKRQRQVWVGKPVLRILYKHWYARVLASLSPLKPIIEIGSGCGNFKEFCPEVIATDVYTSGPWIERVLDAHNLTIPANEAGNLVAFDVLHHLQRPLDFLRRAAVVLRPGGRLVLCEPAVTPWSRFVYGILHHENLDAGWDLFGLDGTPPRPDQGRTFANMAIAEIIFGKQVVRTLKLLPSLRLVEVQKFGFVLYPLTGGFSYRSFVPEFGFESLLKWEDRLTRPFANWLTGMRMLVVMEKIG